MGAVADVPDGGGDARCPQKEKSPKPEAFFRSCPRQGDGPVRNEDDIQEARILVDLRQPENDGCIPEDQLDEQWHVTKRLHVDGRQFRYEPVVRQARYPDGEADGRGEHDAQHSDTKCVEKPSQVRLAVAFVGGVLAAEGCLRDAEAGALAEEVQLEFDEWEAASEFNERQRSKVLLLEFAGEIRDEHTPDQNDDGGERCLERDALDHQISREERHHSQDDGGEQDDFERQEERDQERRDRQGNRHHGPEERAVIPHGHDHVERHRAWPVRDCHCYMLRESGPAQI